MIGAFEFYGVGRVIFGRGKIGLAAELAAGLGARPMVIYNGDGVVDRLIQMIPGANVRRQRGEPAVEHVDAAVEEARRAKCDSLIALGGGSAGN